MPLRSNRRVVRAGLKVDHMSLLTLLDYHQPIVTTLAASPALPWFERPSTDGSLLGALYWELDRLSPIPAQYHRARYSVGCSASCTLITDTCAIVLRPA
jgi:hypothetical protein